MKIMNKFAVRTLKVNKTRTIVTIIGVMLSIALMTAVTVFTSSLLNYLIKGEKYSSGDWHIAYTGENEIVSNEINSSTKVYKVGYLNYDDMNSYSFAAIDSNYQNIFNSKLIEGRMPESEDEIIVFDYKFIPGEQHKLGDTIELKIFDDEGNEYSKTVKIVGQADNNRIGNTYGKYILTFNQGFYDKYTPVQYFNLKDPKNVFDFNKNHLEETGISNSSLLRMMGISGNASFIALLSGLLATVISLILLASVSLILNSFTISINERTKQFGMLSSIGATASQINKSVLFEAFIIAVIGIALGVLVGIGGISITLILVGDIIKDLTSIPVSLSPYISLWAVIVPVVIGIITVLISAYIPARRATRIPTVDAIRQTKDVKLSKRKIKTSKLTDKLFGIGGTLAIKNFKRNKKRYRSTVFSLTISVVLFISASSLVDYIKKSTDLVIEDINYNIYVSTFLKDSENKPDLDEYFNTINNIGKLIKEDANTNNFNYATQYNWLTIKYDENVFNSSDFFDLEHINLIVFSDELYNEYLKSINYSIDEFNNKDKPKLLALSSASYYSSEDEMFVIQNFYKTDNFSIELNDFDVKFDAALAPNEVPELFENYIGNGLEFLLSESVYKALFQDVDLIPGSSRFLINSFDPDKTEELLTDALSGNTLAYYVNNHQRSMEESRSVIFLVNVFAYGFIILISLVAVANVFNTISTSLLLRGREFAMLKSVGMTKKGMNRMMNFECILYGVKGLLYGIPISVLFTYFIYNSILNLVDLGFYIPPISIIISVVSVFIVVFASMIYAMNKLKKKDIIDTLKTENF
ncbi:FtsX-like permease family protein [Eubacteriales bacterium OttesenSCG-928-G02]|nr:FtsX-like permease family protein [Eubacteriales bacterium OttesenSCG-928-G02]